MRRFVVMLVAAMLAVLVPATGAEAASCPAFDDAVFPGGEVTERCEVVNQGPRDATFYLYILQSSITVFDADGNEVTDARKDTFVDFFRLSLSTQRILTASTPTDGEEDDLDLLKLPEGFRTTCDEVPLTDLTGDTTNGFGDTHCEIGRVRRNPSYEGGIDLPIGSHRRLFDVTLHFADAGNQNEFANWAMGFSPVIRARVGAASDCASEGCPPVYER